MSVFLIVDGNSIACRAIEAGKAIPGGDCKTKAGKITGGTYRFFNMLDRVMNTIRPSHVAIAFDTSRDTFRTKIDASYKANRGPAKTSGPIDNEMYHQMADIKRILDAVGIKHVNVKGFEGDDIVGTLAKSYEKHCDKVFILSGDRDIFQLVDNKISVMFPIKGVSEMEVYTPLKVEQRFGIPLRSYIDYKCILGDDGDNIKGINDCGEKTTKLLLNKFGSLNKMIKELDNFDGKDDAGKKIRNWEKIKENIKTFDVEKTKLLVTIRTDVPTNLKFSDCKIKFNWKAAEPIFKELEFNTYISKVKAGKFYGCKKTY